MVNERFTHLCMEKRKTQLEFFVEKFGSQTKLAKALGHNNPTTIHSWIRSGGQIPSKYHQELYHACKTFDVEFSPADFLVVPELQELVREMERETA